LDNTLSKRPDISFHILSNGQHLNELHAERLLGLARDKIEWGIPLYSADPALHDQIVKKEGAFEKVMETLDRLATIGSRIELRTVIMKPNLAGLPRLSEFITRHLPYVSVWALMQLENIGYGRMNWNDLFEDNSVRFSEIGDALDIAKAKGISAQLYNFPRCTIPEAYRALAPSTISDWKQRYLPICDGCEEKSDCSGFFEWYPDKSGYSRLGLQGG